MSSAYATELPLGPEFRKLTTRECPLSFPGVVELTGFRRNPFVKFADCLGPWCQLLATENPIIKPSWEAPGNTTQGSLHLGCSAGDLVSWQFKGTRQMSSPKLRVAGLVAEDQNRLLQIQPSVSLTHLQTDS